MYKAINNKTNAELYLEYFNDFITVKCIAEYYNVSRHYMNKKINQGRKDHNNNLIK